MEKITETGLIWPEATSTLEAFKQQQRPYSVYVYRHTVIFMNFTINITLRKGC
jgi:hypothetical protein